MCFQLKQSSGHGFWQVRNVERASSNHYIEEAGRRQSSMCSETRFKGECVISQE